MWPAQTGPFGFSILDFAFWIWILDFGARKNTTAWILHPIICVVVPSTEILLQWQSGSLRSDCNVSVVRQLQCVSHARQ